MKHHLIKEEDTARICPYCSRSLINAEFISSFFGEKHYKCFDCECGNRINIRITEFIGSGHDDWNKRRIRKMTLEDKMMSVGAGQ